MLIAQLPLNETERLQNLLDNDILNTPEETDFDELVELASQICNCPISLITLLDKERQWFKSKRGIDSTETSRNAAFCSHAILQEDVFVVENALEDERFHDNPLVTGDPNVRFYAGAPIVSPEGYKLGTICIIDKEPRKFSVHEERALKLLSNQVTKLLDVRRKNNLIRQRAEEIIALKSKAIASHLKETEEIKQSIAFDLHENFAQNIASGIMFLKMAEENIEKAPSIIQSVKNQLSETLLNIRDLSYKVTPVTGLGLTTIEIINEYFKSIAVTFPFHIRISGNETSMSAVHDVTLATVRVTEQWLKLLSYKKDVNAVKIQVDVNDALCVTVTDDERNADIEQREKEILQNILCDQIHTFGGSIDLSVNDNKNNLFAITLPLNANRRKTLKQAV